MAKRKYPYDPERVRRIFEENSNPSAHQKLIEYLRTEVFPESPDMSEEQKKQRELKINLAQRSACESARQRGAIKPHHNAKVHASAWPEEKKARFIADFLLGRSPKEFAADDMFKEDFAYVADLKIAMHNFARDIGIGEKEREERIAALKAGHTKVVTQLGKEHFKQLEESVQKRIKTLCDSGILLKENGSNLLYEQIQQEFKEELERLKYTFAREKFTALLADVVWTEGSHGSLTVLTKYIQNGAKSSDIKEKYCPYYPNIPYSLVEKREQEIRGISNRVRPPGTSASFMVPGVGRFGGEKAFEGGDDFTFPIATANNPHELQVDDPDNWDIIVANGCNIGLEHDPVIKNNPVVKLFSEAEHRKVAGLIITNPIDVDTLKTAGPSKIWRALVSGIEEGDDVMDPAYQEEARRIFESHPNDEVVYITSEEYIKEVRRAWRKISRRPKEEGVEDPKDIEPMYSGPVLIAGGPRSGQVTAAIAYGQVHYATDLKEANFRLEKKIASRSRDEAEEQVWEIQSEASRLEDLFQHSSESEQADLQKNIDEVNQALESAVEHAADMNEHLEAAIRLLARPRMSFVHSAEWKRFFRKASAYYSSLFEDREDGIPNAKVFGFNGFYLKIGGKHTIKVHIPKNTRVTDTHLSDYASSYGPEVLRGQTADLTVVAPYCSLGYRTGGREADFAGKRKSVQIAVAPMLVDDEFIRVKIREIVQLNHPVGRATFNEQITPGAMLISCRNGIISTSPMLLESLKLYEARKRGPEIIVRGKKPDLADKYWCVFGETDIHVGSRSRERLGIAERGERFSVGDAVFDSWRQCGFGPKKFPPAHMYVINDDPTQGQHFEAHRQPDQKERPFPRVQKDLQQILQNGLNTYDIRRVKNYLKQMLRYSLRQIDVRGVDWHGDQMKEFGEAHLHDNIDIFDGILRRFENSGGRLKPISEFERESFEDEGYDRRDVGVINFGTGNHSLKTLDYHLAEGEIYAMMCRFLFNFHPYWKDKSELLERYIRGPVYGNEFIAYGTFGIPGVYEWGLDLRNTPASFGTNWGDPLLYAMRISMRRGNVSRILEKIMTLCLVGDKHFYTVAMNPHLIEVMSPPSARTDKYAERAGLPPNDTGVMFVLLPVEGPKAGPILLRPLMFDMIKEHIIKRPRSFDWEEFLFLSHLL